MTEVVRRVKNWQHMMKFLIDHCPWVQSFGMTFILPFCTRSTLIQLSSTIHAGHHVNGNTLPPTQNSSVNLTNPMDCSPHPTNQKFSRTAPWPVFTES